MRRVFLLLHLLYANMLSAQYHLVDSQQHVWFITNGNHRISDKFSWMHDFQLRRDDWGIRPQQILLRSGLSFEFQPDITATVGYAYIETFPYGGFPVKKTFSEHRIWQQIQAKERMGKVDLTHRYRLEQRLIETFLQLADGKSNENYFRLENRMRYMIRLSTPLKSWVQQKLYVLLYNETFINFGKKVAYNIFDQNRLGAGIGYSFNPRISMEVAYLNQYLQQRGMSNDQRLKFENNHTFTLTNTFNF